jgi:uncharacterized membrane-anchored protein YitT (DUF2179 family)
MTGSTVQLINGIFLLVSFFGARIIYGSYISVSLFYDIYRCLRFYHANPDVPPLGDSQFHLSGNLESQEVITYARANGHIPTILWTSYLASNVILHFLNIYWFGQMISALRKRFDPPLGTRSVKEKEEAEAKAKEEEEATVKTGLEIDGQTELKKRPVANRMVSDMPPPT